MTYDDLKLIVDSGKRPLVCFTKAIHNLDSQFEEGMLAEVLNLTLDSDGKVFEVTLSEQKYQEYNRNLEKPIWYDSERGEYCKKYSEQDERMVIESIYDEVGGIENFVLKDGNMDIFNEYLKSGPTIPYVEWLEENLSACRALLN